MFYLSSEALKKKHLHKHVFLLIDGQPRGISSIDDNHQHEAVFDENVGWVIIEVNNHTHIIVSQIGAEPYIENVDDNESEEAREIVDESYSLFSQALDNEGEAIDEAKTCVDFYRGKHWSDQAKHTLESEGRPVITINLIGAMCDRLHGYFLQSLPDIQVYPVSKEDDVVADIIQKVVKNILQNSNQRHLFGALFLDQLVAGKAVASIEVAKNGSLQNDITITRQTFDGVVYGSHNEITLSDCQYMCKYYYLSKSDIKLLYPEKYDELKPELENPEGNIIKGEEYTRDNYAIGKPVADALLRRGVKFYDEYTKQYLMLEIERKINYTKHYVTVGETSTPMNLNSYEIRAIRTMGFEVEKVLDYTIRKDITCGKVLISSEDTEMKSFSCVPIYSKYVMGKWMSKITDAKDINKEANKRASQMTEIVNRCASYAYFYDSDTFGGNIAEESAFKRNAARPGAIFKIQNLANRPQMQEGIKVPAEVITLEETMYKRLEMLFGQIIMQPGQTATSRALMQNQRYQLLVNEHLWENFNNALKLIGKSLITYIQTYYTPQQILRIIRNAPVTEQEKTPWESMEDNEILKLLMTTDVSKYDVNIDTSKYSVTNREATAEVLAPLVQAGMVPASSLIEYSSMPNKTEIIAQIQAQEQQKQESQKSAEDSESKKCILAQGISPEDYMPLKLLSYNAMIKNGVPPEVANQLMQNLK